MIFIINYTGNVILEIINRKLVNNKILSELQNLTDQTEYLNLISLATISFQTPLCACTTYTILLGLKQITNGNSIVHLTSVTEKNMIKT